jgi:hypothetical protein
MKAAPALPPLLGALRRRRRVFGDGATSTWEAWDTGTGERVFVRPLPLRDEELRASLAALPPLPLPVVVVPGSHALVRTAPVACCLADLLPIDHTPGPAWIARFALGTFSALAALHATGNSHGWIGAESVVATQRGWTLAWLGPVGGGAPTEDLHALSKLVAALDPTGPIGELVGGFVDAQPPSAADATRLLLHACTAALAREHHALVRRARQLGAVSGRLRLQRLAGRLHAAMPPPRARGCVAVDADGVALTVESDGVEVTGARALLATDPPSARFVVAGPAGLDPVAARLLLRAWAARTPPCEDEAVAALMRWVAAASRLRVDRLVLATLAAP